MSAPYIRPLQQATDPSVLTHRCAILRRTARPVQMLQSPNLRFPHSAPLVVVGFGEGQKSIRHWYPQMAFHESEPGQTQCNASGWSGSRITMSRTLSPSTSMRIAFPVRR